MSDYEYRRIRSAIEKNIYDVNAVYVRQRKQLPFNPKLYNKDVGREIIELCIAGKNNLFVNDNTIMVLLERIPDPNTTDVLGKSLLEYLIENKNYEEAIRLIKMGATPSQNVMLQCLKRNLFIDNYITKKIKSYNELLVKLLIEYGIKPLTQEQLLKTLYTLNNADFSFINDVKQYENIKIKCLLSFEKRLKMMYHIYIGIQSFYSILYKIDFFKIFK